jgi:2-polyprenyl-3-methyl-5-hydroxy-6-metoxy-1,4-benzoquinol methylase
MEQFNKITSWWHPASEMNVLFQYNNKRIDFLRSVIKNHSTTYDQVKPVKNMKIIDVGCGAGFLS